MASVIHGNQQNMLEDLQNIPCRMFSWTFKEILRSQIFHRRSEYNTPFWCWWLKQVQYFVYWVKLKEGAKKGAKAERMFWFNWEPAVILTFTHHHILQHMKRSMECVGRRRPPILLRSSNRITCFCLSCTLNHNKKPSMGPKCTYTGTMFQLIMNGIFG